MLISCSEIASIVNSWETDKIVYDKLTQTVQQFLGEEISQLEILPTVTGRTKDFHKIIKKIIKKRSEGKLDYSYSSLKDKTGIRIVCTYKSEFEKVNQFINEHFDVKGYDPKSEKLRYNELDYVSDHYDVILKENHPFFIQFKELFGLVFEIQVRTINQDCWAYIAHSIFYKQEISLPERFKRRIFRLVSLYELADDEFDQMNSIIINSPEFPVYQILNQIEGKFYKFAKIPYDGELSFYNILNLIKTFGTIDKSELDKFLMDNEEKLKFIFSEQGKNPDRNIFTTQPEAILIWHLLEKSKFQLTAFWQQYYDMDDLLKISTIWGMPID